MYRISLPILGFEEITKAEITKIDEHFSKMKLLDKHEIHIVNISYLEKSPFDFNIDDKTLKKLHINIRSDFDIYFAIVLQQPIEESIINLTAPIFINHKNKLLGQYIIKDKIPKLFTTIKDF